jgi:hypothetical protein
MKSGSNSNACNITDSLFQDITIINRFAYFTAEYNIFGLGTSTDPRPDVGVDIMPCLFKLEQLSQFYLTRVHSEGIRETRYMQDYDSRYITGLGIARLQPDYAALNILRVDRRAEIDTTCIIIRGSSITNIIRQTGFFVFLRSCCFSAVYSDQRVVSMENTVFRNIQVIDSFCNSDIPEFALAPDFSMRGINMYGI